MTAHPPTHPHSKRSASSTGDAPRHPAWASVPREDWDSWTWQLRNRVGHVEQLSSLLDLTSDERRALAPPGGRLRVASTPYYLSLIDPRDPLCPIRRQVIPTLAERVTAPNEQMDSLGEDDHSPVIGVVHRYPDRALLYTTHDCPSFCRHCTRGRKVSNPHSAPTPAQLEGALCYIAEHTEVRDVLISGGDPLTLPDERVLALINALRDIPHVEVIRLCTRTPVTLPQRITPALAQKLTLGGPLYVQTHVNHPLECTGQAGRAFDTLRRAGCIINNQMVLLRGVNDDPEVVLRANRWLLAHGVRPYYLLQCDMAAGLSHLRTPLSVGTHIIAALRGRIAGLGIPTFVVDLPGGAGKVPVEPSFIVSRRDNLVTFRNWLGQEVPYLDPE